MVEARVSRQIRPRLDVEFLATLFCLDDIARTLSPQKNIDRGHDMSTLVHCSVDRNCVSAVFRIISKHSPTVDEPRHWLCYMYT